MAVSYLEDVLVEPDGQGLEVYGGGRFYKRVGTGIVTRLAAGNVRMQVENNAGTILGTYWDSGNLTNLNQLTNGPGYLTASALAPVNYGSTFETPGVDPFSSRGSYDSKGGVRTWDGAGPFGSVWYNVVDVRHRNAWNPPTDVWGGELAWGMTGYTDRLAFRSRNGAGTPGAWSEVAVLGKDVIFSTIELTKNTAGDNIKVGNDVYLGDVDLAYTLGLKGQGTGGNQGYIKFGSGYLFGYNGSNLVYNNNRILTELDANNFPTLSGNNTFTGSNNFRKGIDLSTGWDSNTTPKTQLTLRSGVFAYGLDQGGNITGEAWFGGTVYNSMYIGVSSERGILSNGNPFTATGFYADSSKPHIVWDASSVVVNKPLIKNLSEITYAIPTITSSSIGTSSIQLVTSSTPNITTLPATAPGISIALIVVLYSASAKQVLPPYGSTILWRTPANASKSSNSAGSPNACILSDFDYVTFTAVSSTEWVASGVKT